MGMRTAFGWVEIDDQTFENDVVFHVDRSVTKRKKKLSKGLRDDYGHTPLSEHELKFLDDERPEVVIIGTGQSGSLPITPKAQKILDHYDVIVERTPQAIESMAHETRPYVAILHVTC